MAPSFSLKRPQKNGCRGGAGKPPAAGPAKIPFHAHGFSAGPRFPVSGRHGDGPCRQPRREEDAARAFFSPHLGPAPAAPCAGGKGRDAPRKKLPRLTAPLRAGGNGHPHLSVPYGRERPPCAREKGDGLACCSGGVLPFHSRQSPARKARRREQGKYGGWNHPRKPHSIRRALRSWPSRTGQALEPGRQPRPDQGTACPVPCGRKEGLVSPRHPELFP